MTTPLILLALLVLPYLLLAPVPWFRERPSLRGCIGLALVFSFTGLGHFLTPRELAQMVPPAIPWRVELIYISGVVEVLLGLGVLPRATRPVAGRLLIALLVAFLPANVYAAIERVPVGGHAWGPIYLWIRVPLQAALGAWCYVFAVRGGGRDLVRTRSSA